MSHLFTPLKIGDVTFRNRVFVLLEWAWSYITFRRGARLITGPLPDDVHHQV